MAAMRAAKRSRRAPAPVAGPSGLLDSKAMAETQERCRWGDECAGITPMNSTHVSSTSSPDNESPCGFHRRKIGHACLATVPPSEYVMAQASDERSKLVGAEGQGGESHGRCYEDSSVGRPDAMWVDSVYCGTGRESWDEAEGSLARDEARTREAGVRMQDVAARQQPCQCYRPWQHHEEGSVSDLFILYGSPT